MTLNDHNADDMLKGTLMQNKPSELFLHYLKYQPDLVNEVYRQGLRYEYIANELLNEMDAINMDRNAIIGEIRRSLEVMPSREFH